MGARCISRRPLRLAVPTLTLVLALASAGPALAAAEAAQPSLLEAAEAAAQPAAELAPAPDQQVLALEGGTLRLRTAELGLWMVLRRAEALRSGDRFDIVDASLETFALLPAPAAVVPLPPALWLLVVGLLGLAGVRLTKPPAAARPAALPQPA